MEKRAESAAAYYTARGAFNFGIAAFLCPQGGPAAMAGMFRTDWRGAFLLLAPFGLAAASRIAVAALLGKVLAGTPRPRPRLLPIRTPSEMS